MSVVLPERSSPAEMRASLAREIDQAERAGLQATTAAAVRAVLPAFAEHLRARQFEGASGRQLAIATEIAAAALLGHLLLNVRARGVSTDAALDELFRGIRQRVRGSLLAEMGKPSGGRQ